MRAISVIIIPFLLFGLCLTHFINPKLPKLLLISFDGFRHDYVDMARKAKKNVSSFDSMISGGVHAEYVQGVFTSVTFPSHTSIISGMYEESHGIVNNDFYDPLFNDTFHVKNTLKNVEPKWWNYGYEPIWITNERQGHDSAVINYPGCGARYGGVMETYSNFIYNNELPWSYWVNIMIGWLEKEHTTLGILYHPEPDATGHSYGPDSPEMLDQIEKANGRLAFLLKKVAESSNLRDSLNIMLVSDHGMAQLSKARVVQLNELIPKDWYHSYSNEGVALWGLWPKNGKEDQILAKLKNHPHLKAWKKKDVPPDFHYSNNRRIPPIVILAADQWALNGTSSYSPRGAHGYNNSLSDMHPFFMAKGPVFKRGLKLPVVHMVDYYSLMCHILGLVPHANNGSFSRIASVLTHDDDDDDGELSSTFLTYVLILLPIVLISAVFSLAAVQQIRYHYLRVRHVNGVEMKRWNTRRHKEQLSALLKEEDSSDDDVLNNSIR